MMCIMVLLNPNAGPTQIYMHQMSTVLEKPPPSAGIMERAVKFQTEHSAVQGSES